VNAGPEWTQVELVAEPKEAFAAGGTVLTCHLGAKTQTVAFADVRVEQLP
jgi:hypothetical protein